MPEYKNILLNVWKCSYKELYLSHNTLIKTQGKMSKFKKVKTLKDIQADPRVSEVTRNYEGPGCHLVEAKKGWLFWGETMTSIGDSRHLCQEVNEYLIKDPS